jgi:hypothetical protein
MFKAFSASCISWSIVAFPQTFWLIVNLHQSLFYLISTAKPLSDRYWSICKYGVGGLGPYLWTNPNVPFLSLAPEPEIRRTLGNGPFPIAGRVNWALVFTQLPKSITKFLYFIVWMYCWASAWFCCLKILVDKQDNASTPIDNNPRDSLIVFVIYNSRS